MKLFYKKIGETPLNVIKTNFNDGIKRTYAGRLDPLAEGLLIILEGEECLKTEEFLKLDKIYEYEGVIGIKTDTLDLLGLIEEVKLFKNNDIKIIKSGEYKFNYPNYSSKTVNGIPLWTYSKNNKLDSIEIPQTQTIIKEHKILNISLIKGDELAKEAITKINFLKGGDFRQQKIIEGWNNFAKKYSNINFIKYIAIASVKTGSYIRSIALENAKINGNIGIATNIKRIKIGKYSINDLS